MSIDNIFTDAKSSMTALFRSGGAITDVQNAYACHQLESLRLKIHALNSAQDPAPPTAADFLKAGLKHMDSRAATHDKPEGERSMGKTVAVFNIYTDHDLSEEEGWLFMNCLKKARSLQGEFNADNYEDDAAYCGLRGEAAARERAK